MDLRVSVIEHPLVNVYAILLTVYSVAMVTNKKSAEVFNIDNTINDARHASYVSRLDHEAVMRVESEAYRKRIYYLY